MRMLSSFASLAPRASSSSGAPKRETSDATVLDFRIGDLLRRACKLDDGQIARIMAYHQDEGLRFGEAAIDLGLVRSEHVLWALSQQFHYPYALDSTRVDAELVVAANPFSEDADTFRELRSQLLAGVLGKVEARPAVAVVSAAVGDGKTYLAANLAVAMSQLGGPTLLIDADMRTPRQHELFGFSAPRIGLSSMLSGRTDDHIIRCSPELPTLFVLPVGAIPPNPLELLQRPGFALMVKEMKSKFDYVVVDTPAASHGADARIIAGICGAAVVVGRRGRSRIRALNTLLTGVMKSGASVAGMVINER